MIMHPQVLPIKKIARQRIVYTAYLFAVITMFIVIAYLVIQQGSEEEDGDEFDGLLFTPQVSEIKFVSIYEYKVTKETALVFDTTTFGRVILILDSVEYNKLKEAMKEL